MASALTPGALPGGAVAVARLSNAGFGPGRRSAGRARPLAAVSGWPAVASHQDDVVWVGGGVCRPVAWPGAPPVADSLADSPASLSASAPTRASPEARRSPRSAGWLGLRWNRDVRLVGFLPGQLPAGAGLVLGPVLAGIGVLLGVERPVRPGRRSVPRRPAPVGLERFGIRTVVRRRAERRLVRWPVRPGWPARAGRPFRAGRAVRGRSPSRARSPRRACPPAAAVRAVGRIGAVAVGVPGASRPGRSRRSRPAGARHRVPRSGRTRPGSRGIGAGRPRRRRRDGSPSPAVGRRGAPRRAWRRGKARAFGRDRLRGPWSDDGRSGRTTRARARVDQPISSPTGASWNSAIASAPTRPCGSRIVGLW